MRALDLLPGVPHLRRGDLALGAFTFVAFALLVGAPLVRHDLVADTVRCAWARLADPAVLRTERYLDVLLSAGGAAIAAGLLATWSLRAARRPRSPRLPFIDGCSRSRLARFGACILAGIGIVAILCPFLAPGDPETMGDLLTDSLLPPSLEHPLGTDENCRDVASRLIYGSRVSLFVGVGATAIAVIWGTLWGGVAGYFGGLIDALLMRVVDAMMCFPPILVVLTVLGVSGSHSILYLTLTIGAFSWMGVARLMRGRFLELREADFVLGARALGASAPRIVLVHILPNALPPLLVFASTSIGSIILVEASLSYLGLGVGETLPSWGRMISDHKRLIFREWWIPFSACSAVLITLAGANFLADGLRDALDPRGRPHA